MARPRKSIEEKRAAKARYAREHSKTAYDPGFIQSLLDTAEASDSSMPAPQAAIRRSGSLGNGARWARTALPDYDKLDWRNGTNE